MGPLRANLTVDVDGIEIILAVMDGSPAWAFPDILTAADRTCVRRCAGADFVEAVRPHREPICRLFSGPALGAALETIRGIGSNRCLIRDRAGLGDVLDKPA